MVYPDLPWLLAEHYNVAVEIRFPTLILTGLLLVGLTPAAMAQGT